jgi:phosphoserine phosphatase RsbU/P
MPTPLELQIRCPGIPVVNRAFDGNECVVGRSQSVDVVLNDSGVSRRHARLFRRDGRWFVEDLGSRNGTSLNGIVLAAPSPLEPGDEVKIGDWVLRMAAGADPWPAAAPSAAVERLQMEFSVVKPAAELMSASMADTAAASHLRVLNEVHRALAAPISRDDLLQMILERAFAILRPDYAAIFLKHRDGELVLAAERRSPKATGALLVSRRLADEVTVKGAAALVLDAPSDERFASQSVIISGVRSIVAAPLSDSDGCLGMIALYSNVHARRFSEQDLELLVSLAAAAALRVRNISLTEQAVERRVVDRELQLAREIQAGMLRHRSLGRNEVDVAARQLPARLVGGDFYEFQLVANHLVFIVGDVAGKGVAAALMMVMSQTLFRAIATLGLPLDDVMSRMNRELARDNERAMFVTAIAGSLDLATGRLELANAGHNLPYLLRGNGSIEQVPARNSLALGVMEEVAFPLTELVLEPGDGLFVHTDGVGDAVNPGGAVFGTDGLEHHLRALARERPDVILDGLFHAVDAFAGQAAQEDDITVAVIRYRGPLGANQ